MKKFTASIIIIGIILSLYVSAINASSADAAAYTKIISRASWGADESLRLFKETNPEPELVTLVKDFYTRYAPELKLTKIVDKTGKGEDLTWPLQYPKQVTKIIIHHTATTKNLDNPVKAVKDLYYYHTISRGWGDIGYNYIIDTKGNIYEGRAGGNGVVGAHAGPGNRGSIGIAVLGNYNDSELSAESQKALENLISEKTKEYGIDPMGESYFRGKKLSNIFGHGEIMATSCPGKNITNKLTQIRQDVAKLNGQYDYKKAQAKQKSQLVPFELIGTNDPIKLPADQKFSFQIKIKNTGKTTWKNGTKLIPDVNSFIQTSFNVFNPLPVKKDILPGQMATFTVTVNTKLNPGFFYLSFKPLFNNKTNSDDTIDIPVIVDKPYFAYEVVNLALPRTSVKVGESITAIMTLKNTGNVSWRNYGDQRISLGADNPRDRISSFTQSSRMGYLKENLVQPGQNGHFVFTLKAPDKTGFYEEYFAPVIEKITWLDGKGMKIALNVFNP